MKTLNLALVVGLLVSFSFGSAESRADSASRTSPKGVVRMAVVAAGSADVSLFKSLLIEDAADNYGTADGMAYFYMRLKYESKGHISRIQLDVPQDSGGYETNFSSVKRYKVAAVLNGKVLAYITTDCEPVNPNSQKCVISSIDMD